MSDTVKACCYYGGAGQPHYYDKPAGWNHPGFCPLHWNKMKDRKK